MGAHVKVRRRAPWLAQLAGLVLIVAAVAVLAGWAWSVLLAGGLLVTSGVLAEAGWI